MIGLFGKCTSVANTNVEAATITNNCEGAEVTINIVNATDANITVSVAISTSGTPLDTDWVEKTLSLIPGGVLNRTGEYLSPGEIVLINASAAGAICRVSGKTY